MSDHFTELLRRSQAQREAFDRLCKDAEYRRFLSGRVAAVNPFLAKLKKRNDRRERR